MHAFDGMTMSLMNRDRLLEIEPRHIEKERREFRIEVAEREARRRHAMTLLTHGTLERSRGAMAMPPQSADYGKYIYIYIYI